jgi:hypothetical protein
MCSSHDGLRRRLRFPSAHWTRDWAPPDRAALDAWDRRDLLERVRKVGRNNQGAKGSYSVYQLAAEAED